MNSNLLLDALVFAVMLSIVFIYAAITNRNDARRQAIRDADIKAHPWLYLVREGGTIPDPIVDPVVPDNPTDNSQN